MQKIAGCDNKMAKQYKNRTISELKMDIESQNKRMKHLTGNRLVEARNRQNKMERALSSK
jgi:hypothetical protein